MAAILLLGVKYTPLGLYKNRAEWVLALEPLSPV